MLPQLNILVETQVIIYLFMAGRHIGEKANTLEIHVPILILTGLLTRQR